MSSCVSVKNIMNTNIDTKETFQKSMEACYLDGTSNPRSAWLMAYHARSKSLLKQEKIPSSKMPLSVKNR